MQGSYDKSVRVWDFHDGRILHTLFGHDNRVFRLQFDMFKIVSSSQVRSDVLEDVMFFYT